MRYLQLVVLGIIAGGANAGTGIGWGLITVPVLLVLLGFSAREGVALSVLGALGFWFSLGFHHYLAGEIDWKAALALTCGSFLGGVVGAAMSGVVPDHILKKIIGAMTVLAGAVLLLSKQKP